MTPKGNDPGRFLKVVSSLIAVTVLAAGLTLCLADSTVMPTPAAGSIPDGVVLDHIPEFMGPLYSVDRTLVPDLVVMITLPIARNQDRWHELVQACSLLAPDGHPDTEACADHYPALMDNQDWIYFSLWRIRSDQRLDLLAIAREGRIAGETTVNCIFSSSRIAAAFSSWKSALLEEVWTGDNRRLEEIYDEVTWYTALAEEEEVLRAWYQARARLMQEPCWKETPDYPRCSDCCDGRREGCRDECNRFGLHAYGVGCIGAAIGCAVTGYGAPAAAGCCQVVGGFLSWFGRHYCYINCRDAWHECTDSCDKHFPPRSPK